MRQRGNQYRAHMQEVVPHVLSFPAEPVLRGDGLERPVNYGLARILPPKDQPTDETKRPFIVVDPRAGQGPGIGGFKADSEIGVALAAGHPCYFIGFTPDPLPGQTLEDVMRAEAAFVRKVAELHPDAPAKPAVIANCQAGWQILMAAAVWPELFGPIILAGTPLSYWAGWRGKNPMRYGGGLSGGSWLTALASDMGAGRFDGAWLVQGFENLKPANTLWGKNHHVYANVDTEGPRYLEFEKYWGGYVLLNDVEMQAIVDDLFIGNKLSSGELVTSDGVRIDLRNITSPIVVFCSYGDNITPPPQALGWITDLYRSDNELLGHDRTIVYATHESIGHLGIFVSGSVGRKEHAKFVSNIDLIESLPAGLFELSVQDKTPGTADADLVPGDYLMSIHQRHLSDVQAIVAPRPAELAASDRRFAAAAHVSQMNLALYRRYLQPLVRRSVTPQLAEALRTWHPLRVGYEFWSDRNPLAPWTARQAESVRGQRTPVADSNPWWLWQQACAQAIGASLQLYGQLRDDWQEKSFEAIYEHPVVQALAGLDAGVPARPHPGDTPERRELMQQEWDKLRSSLAQGGLPEATARALLYVLQPRQQSDERLYRRALHVYHTEVADKLDFENMRSLLRAQALLMRVAGDDAIAALPTLLAQAGAEPIRAAIGHLKSVLVSDDPLQGEEAERWRAMQQAFEQAAQANAPLLPAPTHTETMQAPKRTPKKTPTRKTA
ncbi:MAG: DUF3141 domain-containing protein [Proteobacteria bacterium]|nr:DUF3141 domain-containing protein [Pseudomonadota bacterium]MBS0493582.1 DUF3141 domain-containing protein [Pseudomonadota bacterium]